MTRPDDVKPGAGATLDAAATPPGAEATLAAGSAAPVPGAEATLAAGSAAPVPGAEATLAAGSAAPVSGAEATLAAGSAAEAVPATRAGAARARGDLELAPVAREDYVLLGELARGGMGRILAADDRRLGRRVAVKELLGKDPALARRFAREALVTARLQHPSIVPIYQAGTWPSGEPFYVMRLVSGQSLEKALAGRAAVADRLSLLPSFVHVAEALAYAHGEEVIHRDLKPANVLVGDYGETVVIDWGLAKSLREVDEAGAAAAPVVDTELTMHGAVMGTPAYMSPEQARGEAVDARADVYALGAMLYQLLAGRAPYEGPSAQAVLDAVLQGPAEPVVAAAPGAPAELVAIVDKAMARDPAARYPSARELVEELVRFQTGQLVAAHRYTRGQLLRRWARRHRASILAALALVVGAAVAGGVSLRQVLAARDRAQAERRALLEEQGRQELLAGHPRRAAVYLAAALRGGTPSEALRYLLARALADLDAEELALDLGGVPEELVWASGGGRLYAVLPGGRVAAIDLATGTRADLAAVPAEPGVGPPLALGADGFVEVGGGRLGDPARPFSEARLTPDGATLVGVTTTEVEAWDVAAAAVIRRVPLLPDDTWVVEQAHVAPLGNTVLVQRTAGDGTVAVELVDPTTGTVTPVGGTALGHVRFCDGGWTLLLEGSNGDGLVSEVVPLRPGGTKRFARVEEEGRLAVHDAATRARLLELEGGARDVVALALSPDGGRLAAAGADGSLRVYRLEPAAQAVAGHLAVDHGAVSPDGRLAAVVAAGEVRLLDLPEGTVRGRFAAPGARWAAVAGGRVLLYHESRRVSVRDLAGVEVLAPPDPVVDARLAAGGRLLLTSSGDAVQVWDLGGGAAPLTLRGHEEFVTGFTATADGAWLATGAKDGTARVFARDGTAGAVLRHERFVSDVAFDGPGRRVVTASGDGTAAVWDRASGARLSLLRGHSGMVRAASFSPDGARVVTSGDRTLRVWDAWTGAPLFTLDDGSLPIEDGRYSRDGRFLIGGVPGDLRVWDAASGALLDRIGVTMLAAPAGLPYRARAVGDTAADGAALLLDGLLVELRRETRSAAEVDALVADRAPWRLAGGRLVSTTPPRAETEESVALASRRRHLDYDDDLVEGAHLAPQAVTALGPPAVLARELEALRPRAARPDVDAPTLRRLANVAAALGRGDEAEAAFDRLLASPAATASDRLAAAWLAFSRGGREVGRSALAGLGPATAASPADAYLRGWLELLVGDPAAGWSAVAAAAPRLGGDPAVVIADLAAAAARAGVEVEPALAALAAAAPGAAPSALAVALADAALATGRRELREAALARALAGASPGLAAAVRLAQADEGLAAADPLRAAARLEEALAAGAAAAGPEREQALAGVRAALAEAVATFGVTLDLRYAVAARRVARAYSALADAPVQEDVASVAERLEDAVAAAGDRSGELSTTVVRRSLRARRGELAACYDAARLADPALAGKIDVRLRLGSSGEVVAAEVIAFPQPLAGVAACVRPELGRLAFPRVSYATTTVITYPLVFAAPQ